MEGDIGREGKERGREAGEGRVRREGREGRRPRSVSLNFP